MRVTIFQIKAVHTAIFVVLSACVLFTLYSGLAARISGWTWIAVALVIVEGIVLVACGGRCPLTVLAERQGAKRGAVTDLFLPRCFADRIFPIRGATLPRGYRQGRAASAGPMSARGGDPHGS